MNGPEREAARRKMLSAMIDWGNKYIAGTGSREQNEAMAPQLSRK